MSTDEKKPPEGGDVLDLDQVRSRHQVVGRLLAVREELHSAMFLARQRGYPSAGQAIEDHLTGEVEALFARVLPLLERREDPRGYEARVRSARAAAGADSGGTQP